MKSTRMHNLLCQVHNSELLYTSLVCTLNNALDKVILERKVKGNKTDKRMGCRKSKKRTDEFIEELRTCLRPVMLERVYRASLRTVINWIPAKNCGNDRLLHLLLYRTHVT